MNPELVSVAEQLDLYFVQNSEDCFLATRPKYVTMISSMTDDVQTSTCTFEANAEFVNSMKLNAIIQ